MVVKQRANFVLLGLIIPRGQSVSGHVVFPARSPRMRHRSELTEKDWKNTVQGLGKDQGARNRGSKLRDQNPGIGESKLWDQGSEAKFRDQYPFGPILE